MLVKRFARPAVAAAATLAMAMALSAPAQAQYPEKNIKFIIPYSPGGGFDTYVRMVAPYLEKYLPGDAEVVPENMPGAGGRKGITYTYRAKPDGYTIVVANVPGVAIPPILGKKVGYDLNKMTWLARLSTDYYMLAVAGSSKIMKYGDVEALAKKTKIKLPGTGPGSTAYAMAKVMIGALGLNAEIVSGYKGTKEMTVALIRGDTEAAVLPNTSTRKYIQAGDVRPLVTTQDPSPFKCPTTSGLGHDELTGLSINRIVGGPPGMPAAVRKALSDAFEKAMKDPGLIAAAKKAKRPFAPANGEQSEQIIKKQLALFLKFKDDLSK